MSLEYIFKNSFMIISFFMSVLEFSLFEVSIFSFVFIVTSLTVVILLIKIWLKKGTMASMEQQSSPNETLVTISLKKHLTFLKDISKKILDDRKCLEKLLSDEHSAFQEPILEQFECIQPFVRGIINSSLKQGYFAQEEKAKDVFKALEVLESDFSTLTRQFQQLSPILENMVNTNFQELLSSNVASAPTEIPKRDEDIQSAMHGDVPISELMNRILTTIKEDFAKLVLENRLKGKERIQSISRFLEQSQKEIQKEIVLFSSVAAVNEHDDPNNAHFLLIAKVENIEKNLLETFIFLNRQRFDMESMKETLTYFTKKFLFVAAKFDTYWQQSNASYGNAAQKLQEIEIFMNSVTEKMNNGADFLIQQAKDLGSIVAVTSDILTMRDVDFSPVIKKAEKDTCGDALESIPSWIQNTDQLNQKLHELLVMSENSTGRLNSLTLMSKNLESVCNLISVMAEGYGTILSFILSSVEKSGKLKNYQSSSANKRCQKSEACEERKIAAKDDNWVSDDSLWDEVANELNSEFPSSDIRNAIFILKNIVLTTWDLVGSKNNQWGFIAPESPLDNVTSDYLVQNSEESDEDLEQN